MNSKTNEIIKTAQSKFSWLKVSESELKKGIYMILDTRFGPMPFCVYKHSLSESELAEELKFLISR